MPFRAIKAALGRAWRRYCAELRRQAPAGQLNDIGTGLAIVGSSLISGIMGSDAAGQAADATTQSAAMSAAVQREAYNTTRADLAPFRDIGGSALQRLATLTGVSGGEGSGSLTAPYTKQFQPFGGLSLKDFQTDPGYNFAQSEGEKAIQRNALSRGMDKSTGTLRSLVRFNQGLATSQYSDAYNRALQQYQTGFQADTANYAMDTANKERTFNMLQYLATGGQNAAAMTGQAGQTMASGTSQALIQGGLATSQGILGSASSMNNAIQGGLSNYMYQQRFDQMMNRMPVFAPPASSSFGSSLPVGGYTPAPGGTDLWSQAVRGFN